MNSTISDILQIMEKDGISCVLVRDLHTKKKFSITPDVVFKRIDIFRIATKLRCIAQPLSSIVEHLTPLQQVESDASLDEVVALMQFTGCEEVTVVDREQGVVCGVVTCKGLIGFLRHHDEHANAHRMRRVSMLSGGFGGSMRHGIGGGTAGIDEDADDDDDEEALLLEGVEGEGRGKAGSGTGRFSPSQLTAQVHSNYTPSLRSFLLPPYLLPPPSGRLFPSIPPFCVPSARPRTVTFARAACACGGSTSAGRGAPSSSSPSWSSSTSPSASTTSSPP